MHERTRPRARRHAGSEEATVLEDMSNGHVKRIQRLELGLLFRARSLLTPPPQQPSPDRA